MTQDKPTSDRLLKPAEVAEMLGVHKDTIGEWLREGVMPGIKLPGNAGWRIRASDLDAWLKSRESDYRIEPSEPPEQKTQE